MPFDVGQGGGPDPVYNPPSIESGGGYLYTGAGGGGGGSYSSPSFGHAAQNFGVGYQGGILPANPSSQVAGAGAFLKNTLLPRFMRSSFGLPSFYSYHPAYRPPAPLYRPPAYVVQNRPVPGLGNPRPRAGSPYGGI